MEPLDTNRRPTDRDSKGPKTSPASEGHLDFSGFKLIQYLSGQLRRHSTARNRRAESLDYASALFHYGELAVKS